MAEGNLSRKCAYFTKLLTTVCVLVACAFAQTFTSTPIVYRDVLKSRVHTIQNDINQFYDDDDNISLPCHHYPVHNDGFTHIVIFVWVSERETYAMRTCLYQQLKREGEKVAEWAELLQDVTFSLRFPLTKVIFCNRLMDGVLMNEMFSKTKMIGLSLYFNDPQTDGLTVETTDVEYDNSGVPTVSSWIDVRPVKNHRSHEQTFVCNSVQLTSRKIGKLRQRFFSVVSNSSSTETVVKSTLGSSVNVTLDFDVVALNTSRLGLLNDSNIEFLFLSDLMVSCRKRDEYWLNNETNEITYINTTEELVVTPKALMVDNKLRIQVNVSVLVASDHNFGEYVCVSLCKWQTKNSNDTTEGCIQRKFISVFSSEWRYENLIFKQAYRELENRVTNSSTQINNINASMLKQEVMVKRMYKFGTYLNETIHELYNVLINSQSKMLVPYAVIVILSVLLSIHYLPAIYRTIIKRIPGVRQLIDLNAFTRAKSILQSTKNADNRVMKYDVFLSYSSKDRPWVESTLLTFIERKGFKVCYDERDFQYGCNLVDTIARAVYESRKVIAVVSPNYLSSGWCAEYEFVLTYTKILDNDAPSDSLLLIKYRDCQMPDSMSCLKYLDYTRTMTDCDKRSVWMKVWNYVFTSWQKVDVDETPNQKQFFHDLLKWLGKPHIGKQCSVIKSSVARKKRPSRKR